MTLSLDVVHWDPQTSLVDEPISINFPTTGGNPSTLGFYEVYSAANTLAGIWAAPQACLIKVTRIGNICVLQLANAAVTATATTAALITLGTSLPAIFCPAALFADPVLTLDNTAVHTGSVSISTVGALTICSTGVAGTFAGSGSSGVYGFTVCYLVS